jgi:hypothetical protein
MKKLIFCLLLLSSCCSAIEVKVSGQTNYAQQHNKSLITTLNAEYKVTLYEPKHKQWLLFLGGKISPDFDHFGREIKTNVFTTLGFDF